MPAFLVIFLVVVVRGRGLPLRSHVAERLPQLGTGAISSAGVLLARAFTPSPVRRDERLLGPGDVLSLTTA